MRRRKVISGRVNTDGSITGSDFTLSKNAANGGYTLNFPDTFQLESCIPTPTSGGSMLIAHPSSYTDHSVQITVFNSTTGAGTNSAFSFIAVGV